MNDEQLLETIIKETYIKADMLRRIRIVREYLEQLFYTPGEKKNLKNFFTGSEVSADDAAVMHGWGGDFFDSFTKENAYDLLEKVNARVKELPAVNLYVPVELGPQEVSNLGVWFRKNVDRNILIELHVESSTFGGCALAWNGVYVDYSLRHYLHKHTDAIRNVLTEFASKSSEQ